ncbi:hypothetical protein [Kribbella deserti]|uniref:Uncharacterized protein n=1 Tax=Kribbella deserti TaxID=1926257 RepID=A0ABV6QNF7_9ACTN
MTLTEFLTARYDEAEAAERTRMRQRRDVKQPHTVELGGPDPGWTRFKLERDDWWDSLPDAEYNKRYMESVPDPAVLADIAAKRAILADYQAEVAKHAEYWERQRARPTSELHADRAHPDYEYRTTEGQRKHWDDADVPPIDNDKLEPEPGWERNVEEGDNGWQRFDYTEESYWRRLLPEEQRRGPFVPPIPRHIKHLASPYADHPDYQEAWRP